MKGGRVWREDVDTRCLYTINRGLSAQRHSGVSMVSIDGHPTDPVGVHGSYSARLGHPSGLKIGKLAGPLPPSTAAGKYSSRDGQSCSCWRRADSHSGSFCQGQTV